jgi:hypothetical protein
VDGIELERDRVLVYLGPDGPVLSPDELPDDTGLYALWPLSDRSISELGLEDVPRVAPLLTRPFYVGKAEDSVLERVAGKHLVSGDTGHSSPRRSFAALLDLQSQPRRTTVPDPTPKQLRAMTTNFDLIPEDDDRLTRWLAENVLLRAARSTWRPLRDLELAVGSHLRPPLDQDRPPMWSPNPWRPQVTTARRRLQAQARSAAGLSP